MWDMRYAHPIGRMPIRKFLLGVTALVVTSLAYAFLASPVVRAADASWNGAAITYEGRQYLATGEAKAGDSHRLSPGTKIYASIDTPPAGNSGPQKAYLIYFPPSSDPATSNSAQYSVYDFTPPGNFSNPSPPHTISITPQPTGAASGNATSCDSTFTFGIGWIVCPATNFLASAMDWLFGILSGFLVVRPAQTTLNNPLYQAWSIMRNFANVAFVTGFLVIIYSQVTSAGLSSYGAKRLLPRLIIAAILVNVSYWVCAVAIDLSNIVGYAIQDLFLGLRNSFMGGGGSGGWEVTSWKSIGGFILSGGTAAAAAGIGGYALVAGTVGGALYLLLPALVGALMAVLVALLVLAARQAIITILVIVAPLAFVAYLLPNTEKHFEKWKDLFLTMLIMFPAFSAVFGGAQLAGIAIIKNADSINTIILGMIVQVAPVAITPLLLKFSGSLLGKIAGIANNPSRGAIDRTRKWSQERAAQHKARVMANAGPRRRAVLGRAARSIDQKRRARADWQKRNELVNDNNYHGTKAYEAIDMANREAERTKKLIENQHDIHWNVKIRTDASQLEKELRARTTADKANLTKEQMDMVYREIQAGDRSHLRSFNYASDPGLKTTLFSVAHRAQRTAEELAYTGIAKNIADKKVQDNVADALLDNTRKIDGKTLREYAAGIGGVQGQNTALANAVATKRQQYINTIGEMEQLMKHFNPSSESLQELVTRGVAATGRSTSGHTFTFTRDNNYAMEAAIEKQMTVGTVQMVDEIIELSGSALAEYRTSISEALAKAGHTGRSIYQGGSLINEIAKGTIKSHTDLTQFIQKTIADGKFSAAQLAMIDEGALKRLLEAARNPAIDPAKATALADGVAVLKAKANDALTDIQIKSNVKKNAAPILDDIRNL